MTFDRLASNRKARDIITFNVVNRQYIAKFVSPTFRLGPVNAEELNKIDNIEEAIENSKIDDARKEFMCFRLTYWGDFSRKYPTGLRNIGDWE